MMRSSEPLDVVVVPFTKTEPVNEAVRHLVPRLLAAEKAASRRAVVVTPRKQDYGGAMDALVKHRDTATERSHQVRAGGPVVAYSPTIKGLQLAQRLSGGWLGVVEWPSKWFDGWARYMGATNAVTGEKYGPMNAEALEAIADIEWSGNNGWPRRDTLVHGQARRAAAEARAAGLTGFDILGAMIAHGHSEDSIERLMSIIGAD